MVRRKTKTPDSNRTETSPWKQCMECQKFIHMQDSRIHERACSKHENSTQTIPAHGYIKDGTLHAKIITLNWKKKGEVSYPQDMKQVVLMHPSTMKIFGYSQGSYIIILTESDEQVSRCWSSAYVSPSNVLFPDVNVLSLATDCLARIFSYDERADLSDIAIELDLLPMECKDSMKPLMTSKHFLDHLLKEYSKCFVRVGMFLNLCYLGTPYRLKIVSITGSQPNKDSIASLSEQCAKICINDKSNIPVKDLSLNTSACDSSNLSTIEECEHPRMCSTPISMKQSVKFSTPVRTECNFGKKIITKSPHSYFVIESCTSITLKRPQINQYSQKVIYFEQIGGLDTQLSFLKDCLKPYMSKRLSLNDESNVPSGIVLIGPTGTGKSLVIDALKNECHVPVIIVKGKEFNRLSPLSFSTIRRKFQEAIVRAPCVLVLEDMDHLYKKEGIVNHQESHYVTEELARLIDDLPKSCGKKVVVMSVTNKIDAIDSALTRPGRLEKIIEFNIPIPDERYDILRKILEQTEHSLTKAEVQDIADKAHGYTGADLEMICNKALLTSELRAHRNDNQSCILGYDDLLESLRNSKPTSMKEFTRKVPKVNWNDIGGMQLVKQELIDMVDLPLKNAKAFLASGLNPVRGVLMYGPPGCSKTMIAKAFATESKLNFIAVKGPELFNQWVGESEKAVSQLFTKARSSAPCVIFLDEVDSISSQRSSNSSGSNVASRVLSQLLIEIDGIDLMKGVSLIAATNRPDVIDPALLRPGRFDRIIYVPLPDSDARKEILIIRLKKMPTAHDIDYDHLVDLTEGYSGAEIIAVCEEAAKEVIYEDVMSSTSVVEMKHLLNALNVIVPRTSKEQIAFYECYKSQFRCH